MFPYKEDALVKNAVLNLSEAQQKAVEAPADRPSLILAAAGSGKTLVLCHRIVHLISQGVAAKDILAVTFSRRAGQDLLHRLHTLGASVPAADGCVHLEGIRVCTFHSFCLSVLRAFPTQADLSPDFTILTPRMQLQLLEELVKSCYEEKYIQKHPGKARSSSFLEPKTEFYGKTTVRSEAYRIYQQIQRFQNSKKIGSFTENKKVSLDKNGSVFEWVYDKYSTWLKTVNGIDFSDFPRLAIKVLENCPEALAAIGLRTRYVLVDEFQDTDVDQFKLLRLLCRDHKHLTIVGDDDQQIYSWRGAAGFYNLSMFDRVFTGATVTKLEQNFRSTGAIVAAARSVIVKNVNRTQKTIRTGSSTGTLLSVCECRNEQCEAAAVAEFIISLKEQGVPLQEIAVLYRLQHVGFEVQQSLRARGIPCIIKGSGSGIGDGYFGGTIASNGTTLDMVGAVLHDILAVLRLVIFESDDLACKQIVGVVCPALHSSVVSTCVQHLQLHHGMSLLEALKSTRSHLLGLKKHESLSLCVVAEQLSQADEQNIEGVHLLLRILDTAKEDLKKFRIKDVVMNLLQQISPLRGKFSSTKIPGIDLSLPSSQAESTQCNIEFTGIKALLKEAAQFDKERETGAVKIMSRDVQSSGAGSTSYKHLMQQKRRRLSLLASYGSSPGSSARQQADAMKQLQSFLDRVLLKLHDGELGESKETCGPRSESQFTATNASLDAVILSTIHQAKGLEWRAVILVRANEGVLPLMDSEAIENTVPQPIDNGLVADSQSANFVDGMKISSDNFLQVDPQTANMITDKKIESEDTLKVGAMVVRGTHRPYTTNIGRNSALGALEEERRLMYVALTRAKEFLMITHVMFYGAQQMLQSRFLADIPKGLMHRSAFYDSINTQPKIQTSKQVSDTQRQTVPLKCKSIAFGCQERTESQCAMKQYGSQENKSVQTSCSKVSRVNRQRGAKLCKSNMNGVDLEESLKDIDNLLHAAMERGLVTRDIISNHAIRANKENHRFLGSQDTHLVESPSDDSDFEKPFSRGKSNRKIYLSSPES